MVQNILDRALDCLAPENAAALPLYAVRATELERLWASLEPNAARFAQASGFAARTGELVLLPGEQGISGAVLGLGADRSPWLFGDLATRLPEASVWRLMPGDFDAELAALAFCLGAYNYPAFKPPKRAPARLVLQPTDKAAVEARVVWMVRDLINAPANLLGPNELAQAALGLAERYGAVAERIEGPALAAEFPAVAAVGAGSARPPVVVRLHWASPKAPADAPLVSLCGKGVCFDSGGYDLKPAAAMQRMKKDMGGAATVMGLARLIMEAELPVRLALRIACVENSVSGHAMRPMDVLRTRAGFSVEVGNTDAEGRLLLADLLTEACAEKPWLLLDCATLTGAARVALGPDLPALFCNDDAWAEALIAAGQAVHDPLWRLPLWFGYDSWLESSIAHMNNISEKTHAGAIIAALFLQRFVARDVRWAHIDLYAWNDQPRAGRPEGGEAQAMRAIFSALSARLAEMPATSAK
jgi:leucyl aminopeptidase